MRNKMSAETSAWLNKMCLIGDTAIRGNAWHYRADMQTAHITASGRQYLGNHYPGAIPVEDVRDRLFDWEPVSVPVFIRVECSEDEALDARSNGEPVHSEILMGASPTGEPETYRQWYRFIERPMRQAITASDDYSADFNIPKTSYSIHRFDEWLLNNVVTMLDGDVHISSAGLLSGRSQAWVEVSLSEIHTVADFPFKPHLLAYSSLDGTLATNYMRAIQAVVCDNTLSAARNETTSQRMKTKHTKHSGIRIADAREALGLIMAEKDEFSQQVSDLVNWKITGKAFNDVLNALIPLNLDENGEPMSKAAATKNENKRAEIVNLWANDPRCAPWKGTAFGVVQTFNTWQHHFKPTRKDTIRAERNMQDAVKGNTAAEDRRVLNALAAVAS
jgi:phage/plasmid-like protein (TIGR03299 family)